MSTNEELEQRVAKLEAEIAELRRELRAHARATSRIGPPQPLGPQPLSLEEEEARTRRMREILNSAAAQLDKDTLKTAMDTADAAGDKEPIQAVPKTYNAGCQVCGAIPTEKVGLRLLCAQHKEEQLQAWTQSGSADPKLCTTNGKPVADVRASQTNETGQHDGYIVLCPDERAKGFVRPYRDAYKHVGTRGCLKPVPQGLGISPLFCLMDAGHDGDCGSVFGPISKGCGTVTTMGRALSETYARDPKFYGATFCCGCNRHFPVGEFIWTVDGQVVGS